MSQLTDFLYQQAYAAPWRAQRSQLGVIDSFVAPAWRRTIFAWQDLAHRVGLYEGTPVDMKKWVGTLRNFGIAVDESFFGDRKTVPYAMLRYSLANAAQEALDRNATGKMSTYVLGTLGALAAALLDPINVGVSLATFGVGAVAASGVLGARASLTLANLLNPMIIEGVTTASVAKTAIREALINVAILPVDNLIQNEISGRDLAPYQAALQVAAGTVLGTALGVGPALFRENVDLAPEFQRGLKQAFSETAELNATDKLWYAHTIAGQPIGPDDLKALLNTKVLDILKATKTKLDEFENTPLPADWGNTVSGAIDPQFRRTEDQWRIIRQAFSRADRETVRQKAPWVKDVRIEDKFDEWAARALVDPGDVEAREQLTDALAAMYGLPPEDRRIMADIVNTWARTTAATDPHINGMKWFHRLRQINQGKAFSTKALSDDNWRRLALVLKRDEESQRFGELVVEALRRSKHDPKDLPTGFEDLITAYRRKARRPRESFAEQLQKLHESDPVLAQDLQEFVAALERIGAVRFDKKGRLEIDVGHPLWRSADTRLAALSVSDILFAGGEKYHQKIPAILRETFEQLEAQGVFRRHKLPSGDDVFLPTQRSLYALDRNYKRELQDLIDLNEEWTVMHVDVTADPTVRAQGPQPPTGVPRADPRARVDLPEVDPDTMVRRMRENIPEDIEADLRQQLEEFDQAAERFFTQCLTKR